jgi:hypothetical protein
MIHIALALFLFTAQEATTTSAPPPPPAAPADSDLVAASKKSNRPKITHKVITNADVKKSKGKLIELPEKGSPAAAAAQEKRDLRTSLERQAADRKTASATQLRVGAAEKKVAELQKELTALEQSYFDENDLNYRDDVIRKKFVEKKAELDAARAQLDTERKPKGRV